MTKNHYTKPDFPEDAFVGTARYYAKYRVPYPKVMMDDLIKRAGIKMGARLLDLACGPGRVSIPLASLFKSVLSVDIEPEMIELCQEIAIVQGVTNMSWMIGRAENLEIEPASFQLITIGDAFHRLDQWFTATRALQWLSPGCCLALMGITQGTEPWQVTVEDTVRKWKSHNSKKVESAASSMPGNGPDHNERVLQDAGFGEVDSYTFVFSKDWTVDSIIGYLYSTSYCSKSVLGANADDFEKDLKKALLTYNPQGIYNETMHFGYTLGRKLCK